MSKEQNPAFYSLGEIGRSSLSNNREIISATNAVQLGKLFDFSFNAKIGVLSKDSKELERLNDIAAKLLTMIPHDKFQSFNFLIIDNQMDLRNEVFATPSQQKLAITDSQKVEIQKSAMDFIQDVIQGGCINYAKDNNKNWNKNELKKELTEIKTFVTKSLSEPKQSGPTTQILFSKKKDDNEYKKVGNLKNVKDDIEDKNKLLFTSPRAREDSLPGDLIKHVFEGSKSKTYSFLDLLAADGYETKDLETFEQQVILKLDRLKEHMLHQFNPIFNEINNIKKRLRFLLEQTSHKRLDRKSIMK